MRGVGNAVIVCRHFSDGQRMNLLAAHAAQRILDVNAPGFRGATLIGAIIAVVLFLLSTFAAVRSRRHRRSGRDRQLTNT